MNQKTALSRYATDNDFSSPVFFIDNGVSGVTFDRPNLSRMIAGIEVGNVAAVIVRDMSRLGRDYLKAGYYAEILFMERDVRYIAINDGVDSTKGDNDFTLFHNPFNDFCVKDTGKKVRAIKRTQGVAGEHLTKPPYGYIVSPTDKKQWIVDEEAAAVMERIFDLCISGEGPVQIAKTLKADNVLITKTYYAKKKGKTLPDNPYSWKDSSIVGILERIDYCEHTVSFRSYSKSHKPKKRILTIKEQQVVSYNTHEAIIEDAVFERVQEPRTNRRRPTKVERQGLFPSLVHCADYGSKLHFTTCKSFNGPQDHYRCTKYKNNTGSCTTHFIHKEVLKQIVWGRTFDVTALFFGNITAFREMMYQQRSIETEKEMKRKKHEAGQA